jgi:hypothetical protein
MAKHTPGPWYSAYSKTNEFGGGNIRSDHHVDGPGALLLVAGTMFHDYEVDREEELANLHLAASAPELLAALEQLMEWEGDEAGSYPEDDTQQRANEVWQDAFDAIAKATGQVECPECERDLGPDAMTCPTCSGGDNWTADPIQTTDF